MHTTVIGSRVSGCGKLEVPQRYKKRFMAIGSSPWVHGTSKPSDLAAMAIIMKFYVELQPKPRNSRITRPTEFSCLYPKVSYHCASNDTPTTSVANFWWIWWSKTLMFFFFCNRPSRGFFSVLIMYPLRAPPRVSESLVKWNQFEVLDAGVDVRACELSKLCCGLELIIIRCQRSN